MEKNYKADQNSLSASTSVKNAVTIHPHEIKFILHDKKEKLRQNGEQKVQVESHPNKSQSSTFIAQGLCLLSHRSFYKQSI